MSSDLCLNNQNCGLVDLGEIPLDDAIGAITTQEGAGTAIEDAADIPTASADIKFYGKCSGAALVECTLAVPIQMTFDCVGPVTTWVEGLEDTTVGGAGGRPIGFGIDKELKFPKGTYESTFEVAARTWTR